MSHQQPSINHHFTLVKPLKVAELPILQPSTTITDVRRSSQVFSPQTCSLPKPLRWTSWKNWTASTVQGFQQGGRMAWTDMVWFWMKLALKRWWKLGVKQVQVWWIVGHNRGQCQLCVVKGLCKWLVLVVVLLYFTTMVSVKHAQDKQKKMCCEFDWVYNYWIMYSIISRTMVAVVRTWFTIFATHYLGIPTTRGARLGISALFRRVFSHDAGCLLLVLILLLVCVFLLNIVFC